MRLEVVCFLVFVIGFNYNRANFYEKGLRLAIFVLLDGVVDSFLKLFKFFYGVHANGSHYVGVNVVCALATCLKKHQRHGSLLRYEYGVAVVGYNRHRIIKMKITYLLHC